MMKERVSNNQAGDITRRKFMQKTGAVAAIYTAGAMATTRAVGQTKNANEKIGVGVIGAGGRGNGHLHMLNWMKEQGDNIEIVAVCDIYQPRLDKAADAYKAQAYRDHRELLADKNVDVVCIATPDHQHGYQAGAGNKSPIYTNYQTAQTIHSIRLHNPIRIFN